MSFAILFHHTPSLISCFTLSLSTIHHHLLPFFSPNIITHFYPSLQYIISKYCYSWLYPPYMTTVRFCPSLSPVSFLVLFRDHHRLLRRSYSCPLYLTTYYYLQFFDRITYCLSPYIYQYLLLFFPVFILLK